MKKINKKLLAVFLGIVLIAVILRFWQLDSVPPSLDWDEVSWGYNIYSILETGRDEYGKVLPIVVRSLNDYKPALQAYLAIPTAAIFGLSDFTVRFTVALFGVFAVVFTYFLAKELFKSRRIALVSMFLMAVSPWAIQFSRFTHEGMIGVTFNILFVLFFLKGLKKPVLLTLSAVFGALALYSYQNEKIFIPLLALVLAVSFYKVLFKIPKKYLASAFLVGLVISLPIVWFTLTTPEAFTRAKGASFLNNPIGVLNLENYPKRLVENGKDGDLIGFVLDNRRVLYAKAIAGNYLSHFDPNFLFVKGDVVMRHHVPGMGHLYLFELPFLLLGLYFLVFGKFNKNVKKLIVLWLIIVPIPAAITWDIPNAGRTMNFLPVFQMITAVGIVYFYFWIINLRLNRFIKYAVFGGLVLIAAFNFIYYLNQYFRQYNYFASGAFQYGYNQIIPEVNRNYSKYDEIIVSTEVPLDQSHIFFLYHLRYPPSLYQKISSTNEKKDFDKFIFKKIDPYEYAKSNSRQLFVGRPNDFGKIPENKILKEVKLVNGDKIVLIVEGNK